MLLLSRFATRITRRLNNDRQNEAHQSVFTQIFLGKISFYQKPKDIGTVFKYIFNSTVMTLRKINTESMKVNKDFNVKREKRE